MTRAGALSVSRGISRFVSRNGPSTFVASASSLPSAESARSGGSTPALLTSTSRRGSSAVKRAANARTSRRSLTSHRHARTSRLPVASTTAARARSPRSSLRASSRTRAPRRANPSAAARPSPEVAPVTRTVLPSIDRRSSASHARAADPVAGARIARDDRAVENRVEQGADHSSAYGAAAANRSKRQQRGYCRSSGAGRPFLSRARTLGTCPTPRQPSSTPRRPPGCAV